MRPYAKTYGLAWRHGVGQAPFQESGSPTAGLILEAERLVLLADGEFDRIEAGISRIQIRNREPGMLETLGRHAGTHSERPIVAPRCLSFPAGVAHDQGLADIPVLVLEELGGIEKHPPAEVPIGSGLLVGECQTVLDREVGIQGPRPEQRVAVGGTCRAR